MDDIGTMRKMTILETVSEVRLGSAWPAPRAAHEPARGPRGLGAGPALPSRAFEPAPNIVICSAWFQYRPSIFWYFAKMDHAEMDQIGITNYILCGVLH